MRFVANVGNNCRGIVKKIADSKVCARAQHIDLYLLPKYEIQLLSRYMRLLDVILFQFCYVFDKKINISSVWTHLTYPTTFCESSHSCENIFSVSFCEKLYFKCKKKFCRWKKYWAEILKHFCKIFDFNPCEDFLFCSLANFFQLLILCSGLCDKDFARWVKKKERIYTSTHAYRYT